MNDYNELNVSITELGNAAFEEDGGRYELARILRELARSIEEGRDMGALKDINGNIVGEYILSKLMAN